MVHEVEIYILDTFSHSRLISSFSAHRMPSCLVFARPAEVTSCCHMTLDCAGPRRSLSWFRFAPATPPPSPPPRAPPLVASSCSYPPPPLYPAPLFPPVRPSASPSGPDTRALMRHATQHVNISVTGIGQLQDKPNRKKKQHTIQKSTCFSNKQFSHPPQIPQQQQQHNNTD